MFGNYQLITKNGHLTDVPSVRKEKGWRNPALASCLKEYIHDGDGYQDGKHEAKPLEDLCKDITSLRRKDRTNRVVYPEHEGEDQIPTKANDPKKKHHT